jgi:hypothetical protein
MMAMAGGDLWVGLKLALEQLQGVDENAAALARAAAS